MILELEIFFVLGAATGLISGLLGIGGGVILVPGLLMVFKFLNFPPAYLMQYSAATALCCIIPTIGVSAFYYYKIQLIHWPSVKTLVPSMMFGIFMGTFLSAHSHSQYLEILLVIILLLFSVRFYFFANSFDSKIPPVGSEITVIKNKENIPFYLLILVGWSSGFFGGLLGFGGSIFLIPFFSYYSFPMAKASGTSVACLILPAMVGCLTFIFSGPDLPQAISGTTGFVYWPAVLSILLFSLIFARWGVSLSQQLPVFFLRKLFAVILFLSAIHLLF